MLASSISSFSFRRLELSVLGIAQKGLFVVHPENNVRRLSRSCHYGGPHQSSTEGGAENQRTLQLMTSPAFPILRQDQREKRALLSFPFLHQT